LSVDEWAYVLNRKRKREDINKLSEVTLFGKVIATSKIKKAESRFSISELHIIHHTSKLCIYILSTSYNINTLQARSVRLHQEFLFILHQRNYYSILLKNHYFHRQLRKPQSIFWFGFMTLTMIIPTQKGPELESI